MNSKHLTKGSRKPSPVRRGKLRLYSNRFCPYCQRVILVLDAKRIPYEVVNINLVNKPDWMFDKSPMGKVPALELDNGEVLYESLIIADYLDDKYNAHRLHAKDPLQKAKDQLLLKQFTKIINALLKTVSLGRIEHDEAQVISEGLAIFERELTDRPGPFFGGSRPGMLDYMIWPWCERSDVLKIYGKDYILKKEKYKQLMEWRKVMVEDEAVKKSWCSANTHIKYLQSSRAGVPNYDLLI
ncbi:pyrimidodiazepine synthase [Tribolium castaneum]|uniref:Glutathione S-transferase omega-1-like Protein n=1 Tax=Tribolium castaneum TaxID=7070 RepID=D6WGU8_TRICA|nr:PREDICTED: pyrimidodiazepine synthase [Tribolium castaneum]EFA00963.1 Glutathione S-transferase omega-1-like Protein [Tribolium castaneum]|eukprot:XP_967412.1 PREDICTED: pyrimidodiazepine synthase [Tribolium castaneum]